MKQLLDPDEVLATLSDGNGAWRLEENKLKREYRFADFSEAFAFLARVALLAEKAGHHPDIHNSYSKVTLELRSHDAGGITQRDVDLAQAIGELDSGTDAG